MWFFVWRDLKVQYQNPILGFAWSIFQPLVYFGIILMVMRFSGRESDVSEMPFALYLISGLAIWNFITASILGSVNSIQSNAGIISKSFFPRFYLILAPILKSTADLLIMLLIVLGLTLFFGQQISLLMIIALPSAVLLSWVTAVGWSAIASALVVANRHARHAIPVLLYAMMFALPVFYSMKEIDSQLIQALYLGNPVAGAMEILRSGFTTPLSSSTSLFWFVQSLLWLGFGLLVFRRMEKTLADKV